MTVPPIKPKVVKIGPQRFLSQDEPTPVEKLEEVVTAQEPWETNVVNTTAAATQTE